MRAGGEEDKRGSDGWMASSVNGVEFEQIQGESEGQESLLRCSPWGRRQLDMTEQMINNIYMYIYIKGNRLKLLYAV